MKCTDNHRINTEEGKHCNHRRAFNNLTHKNKQPQRQLKRSDHPTSHIIILALYKLLAQSWVLNKFVSFTPLVT